MFFFCNGPAYCFEILLQGAGVRCWNYDVHSHCLNAHMCSYMHFPLPLSLSHPIPLSLSHTYIHTRVLSLTHMLLALAHTLTHFVSKSHAHTWTHLVKILFWSFQWRYERWDDWSFKAKSLHNQELTKWNPFEKKKKERRKNWIISLKSLFVVIGLHLLPSEEHKIWLDEREFHKWKKD